MVALIGRRKAMSVQRLDLLVAALLIIFGLWLIYTGIGYGVMQSTTPGAGLFPIIIGSSIALLSAINLYRALGGLEKLGPGISGREAAKAGVVIAALLIAVWLTPYLGMMIATMLAMAAIGLALRTEPGPVFFVKLTAVAVITPIVLLLLFENLLGVPTPRGPLGF
ncbi:tripartite tricarboxylate transporter TctB family protein [Mesorhizobium sp. M7A.F.Ca.US.011.01.1.1]|nr:tripartite tricarboxylate transporter TctB family protein [Mesorhizobium sp. M7A.F.Ca.US.010.02.1.1]RUX24052.1 tripartite tricarboxylate transporter TctB family protein [Mesorhizobium sp. M7A.F.Ca.US.011.01.1.1]